ncbi:MAG: cation transporter [Eubacteriales bacterium]|nr:cation transporter [Eubacteriales bacterium]
MRKTYRLEELDCANCAAKMETAIGKIDGVQNVSVVFMTQKLVLEADEKRFDEILREVKAVIARVEADCRVVG